MHFLIYVGPAPTRDAVLAFAGPILARAATAVTLVTGGGAANEPLLREALGRLELPAGLPRELRLYEGDAIEALVCESDRRAAEVALIGRLQPWLQRLLRGQQGKRLAQILHMAVLRVQGQIGPVRRILLASGGDPSTVENARQVARLAMALGASVTLLHVASQQLVVFEGFDARRPEAESFLEGAAPEAAVLRAASDLLVGQGVATTTIVRGGPVVDTVVDEARGHDLLVIGPHRAGSPLDRILLEDLTGDILDLSPIPVLVSHSR